MYADCPGGDEFDMIHVMRYLAPILVVGTGGALGSVLRYLLSLLAQRYSVTFPHGTLWANLLGCLAIGMVVTLATATESISPSLRLFLATGICGGFTTMSSFIYELVQFSKDHEYLYAGAYFSLTLFGCMAMFCLGAWLVQWTLKA
jgi:CrcB protein